MIAIELDNESNRKLRKRPRRAGPDRCTHGQQVLFGERSGVPVFSQKLPDCHIVTTFGRQTVCLAVEFQNIQQHSVKRRPQQIAALSEQLPEPVSRQLRFVQPLLRPAPVIILERAENCSI